jgi:hypothetical protein
VSAFGVRACVGAGSTAEVENVRTGSDQRQRQLEKRCATIAIRVSHAECADVRVACDELAHESSRRSASAARNEMIVCARAAA